MIIPASVTEIGKEAFRDCRHLRRVTFAAGSQLKTIGEQSFSNCRLEEIVIPRSVARIGEQAFSGCQELMQVSFQEGSLLEGIGNRCFSASGLEIF